MTTEQEARGHEKFSELCALAMSGSLTTAEQAELHRHLQTCGECRDDYERYLLLTREGIPMLASRYSSEETDRTVTTEISDDHAALAVGSDSVRQRVLARIAATEAIPAARRESAPSLVWIQHALANPVASAIAACLLVFASYGAFRVVQFTYASKQAEHGVEVLSSEKKSLAERLTAQTRRLTELEYGASQKLQQIEQLQIQARAASQREEQHTNELTAEVKSVSAAKAQSDEQLRATARERELLNARLHDLEAAYQNAQTELVNLRAERNQVTLRLASLEGENAELVASNHEQERRLRNYDQYLTSDRDIRELMGARQLYMADVFDVSSDSSTRKPYGRVFYTKGKSLIFYAFDLEHSPGIQNAAFQAWGKNESSQTKPVNLGILYMDNEQNRRWVLRFDDPRRLAEIDAIFVTVEPHGGSGKPTGKPFLYASLRREPNHP